MARLITRFAPSPTGRLHLGHAFSALTAWTLAQTLGGTFLLRMEDIDTARCRPDFEAGILDDLLWLGLTWPEPVMRQSARRPAYDAALARLHALGVTYRCTCTRGDIRAALAAPQEGASLGPEGQVYPGMCRTLGLSGPGGAIRLDLRRALDLAGPVSFSETGPLHAGEHWLDAPSMLAEVGDIVLARRDIGTSYHLAVVVDDAAQGVTHVVRGADLFSATPIHRLLQQLLTLPTPIYHHHRLIRDSTGKRLAKRDDARALAAYRAEAASPEDIRGLLGFQASGRVSSTSAPSRSAV